jgi:hypothetical protein
VPSDSETDDDGDVDSEESIESVCSNEEEGLNSNSSSDEETTSTPDSGGVEHDDIEHDIAADAGRYDFSLDWDGDDESDESLDMEDY